jgi:tetratricopeptide (TPR) repeat protein
MNRMSWKRGARAVGLALLWAVNGVSAASGMTATTGMTTATGMNAAAQTPQDVQLQEQGVTAYQKGDYQAALDAFDTAYLQRADRLGARAVETLQLWSWIGWSQEGLGQHGLAHLSFQIEQDAVEQFAGPQSLDAALLLAYGGVALRGMGKLAEADAAFQQAVERLDLLVPQGTSNTAWVLQQQGRLAAAAGNDARAVPLLQRSLTLYRAVLGADTAELAPNEEDLGNAHFHAGQFNRALPLYQAALAGYQLSYGPNSPAALRLNADLAHVYKASGGFSSYHLFREYGVSDFDASLAYDRRYVEGFLANQQAAFQTLDTDGKVRYNLQARNETLPRDGVHQARGERGGHPAAGAPRTAPGLRHLLRASTHVGPAVPRRVPGLPVCRAVSRLRPADRQSRTRTPDPAPPDRETGQQDPEDVQTAGLTESGYTGIGESAYDTPLRSVSEAIPVDPTGSGQASSWALL